MERQANLVYHPFLNTQWAQPSRHHCACLDLAARRADHHPSTVLDLAFRRQFWTKLGKERRLQRVQPRHPACHRPADMVLGQSIGGNHNRKAFVAYLREGIILPLPIIARRRVTLLPVERVVHR